MKKISYIFYLLVLTLGFAVSAWAQTPPQYVLVKTGTPTHFANGDTITYQLIAFNNTELDKTGFTIVDNVPTGFVVTSVQPSGTPFSPASDTGPTPLTIGPFDILAQSSVTFTVAMTVNVNQNNGIVQTVTNSALLYLNGVSESNSNANGSACAGTNVTMQFTGPGGPPVQGNAMFFPNRQYNQGIIVGDNGAINLFNGVSMVPQNSPTSNDLLGVDGCVDAQGNTQEVVVGKNGTLLMNVDNEGFKLLGGEPYANNGSAQYQDYSHFALYFNGQPLQEYIGANSQDPDTGKAPCSSAPSVAGAKLNLQVFCYETASQERRWKIRITNYGTTPVALSSAYSIVAWFNQSGQVAGQWQGNMNEHSPNGTQIGSYNPNPNTAVAATSYGPCVISGTQVANQQLSLSLGAFNGDVIPPNGGYVDEIQFWASRCMTPPSPSCGSWDNPDTSYTQCPSHQEVDFTSVKVVGCNQAYITTNTGEVLYCSNLANAYVNADGSCFRVIKGGSVCPSDSTPLNTVEVVSNNWLLIGGQNGLFEISSFPQNTASTCATFIPVQFSDGTVPIGSINDIKQIDSGQVFAVGSNGQVFYSPNTTEPGQPIFVSEHLGIPSTRTLTSVDGTDLSHVVFTGPNHVYQFDGTGTQSLTVENNGMTDNTAVQFVIGPDGQVDGEFVLCTGVLTFECVEPPPQAGSPFTNTPTPTPTSTITPTFQSTSGPGTPGSGTITPTPTWTITPTFTVQGGGSGGGTSTPGFETITPTPTWTPTPTPFGGSGGGGGTSTPGEGEGTFTTTPTPTFQPGTPVASATSIFTATAGTGFGETGTPTPTETPVPTSTAIGGGTVTPGPTIVLTPPVVDYHAVACFSAGDGSFITLIAGDDGTLVKRIQTPSGVTQEVIPIIINNTKITADFYSIFACSSLEWWLAGTDDTLVVTQDAGATWTQINLGPSATGVLLNSVTADITCTNIQVTGQNGSLYKFTFNGTSNPVVSGGGPGSFIPGTAAQCLAPYAPPLLSDFTGSGVRFDKTFQYPSTSEQWIVGQDSEGHGFVLHSSGGNVFCRSVLPNIEDAGQPTEITDIFENAPTDIWAVGSRVQDGSGTGFNVILHSSDDGQTWQSFPQLETIPGITNGTSATGVNVVGNTIRVSTTIGDIIQITVDETAANLQAALAEPGAVSIMQIGGTLTAVCACLTCGLDGVIKPISDCSPFGVGNTPTNTPTATATPCQACAGVSITIGVPFIAPPAPAPLVHTLAIGVSVITGGQDCFSVPVTLTAPAGCANFQYCLRSHPTGVPADYTDLGSVVGGANFATTINACVPDGTGSFQIDVYPCGNLSGTACATSNSENTPPTPTPSPTGTNTGTPTQTGTSTATPTVTVTPTPTCPCNGFFVGSGGFPNEWGLGSAITGQLAGPVFGSFSPAEVFPIPDPWNGTLSQTEWVGFNGSGTDNGTVNQVYVYNQTFTIPTLAANYEISILVDDRAAVAINGNLLGTTCSTFTLPACVIQIPASDLVLGTNSLAVSVLDTQLTKTGVDWKITCSCPQPPTATATTTSTPTSTPTQTVTPTLTPGACIDSVPGENEAWYPSSAAGINPPLDSNGRNFTNPNYNLTNVNGTWNLAAVVPMATRPGDWPISCNPNGWLSWQPNAMPLVFNGAQDDELFMRATFTIPEGCDAINPVLSFSADDEVDISIDGATPVHYGPTFNGNPLYKVCVNYNVPGSLSSGQHVIAFHIHNDPNGSSSNPTGLNYQLCYQLLCPTNTATPTSSPTITQTFTQTPTLTLTQTPTSTPSFTATGTPSNTDTPTPSATPSYTLTWTPSPTWTPSATSSLTATFTPTATLTTTESSTFTATRTATNTPTTTATVTPFLTFTPTSTASPTNTFSVTPTRTPSPTSTSTSSPTNSPTWTMTFTATPSFTATFTSTATGTATSTVSSTATRTPTSTLTVTPTFTLSFTPTLTPTPTSTSTRTFTPTPSLTNTQTFTATRTLTATATRTPTATVTSTPTTAAGCLICSGIGFSCGNLVENPAPNPACTGEDVLANLTFTHNGTDFGSGPNGQLCTCATFNVRVAQQSNPGTFVNVGTVTYCASQGPQITVPVEFCVPTSWAGTPAIFQIYTTVNSVCGNSSACNIPALQQNMAMDAAPHVVNPGQTFNLSVTIEDPGTPVASYRGTVHFTSSDPTASLPTNYTFTAADAGIHVFPNMARLFTVGNQTISAADVANPSLSGSTTVQVVAPTPTPTRTPTATITPSPTLVPTSTFSPTVTITPTPTISPTPGPTLIAGCQAVTIDALANCNENNSTQTFAAGGAKLTVVPGQSYSISIVTSDPNNAMEFGPGALSDGTPVNWFGTKLRIYQFSQPDASDAVELGTIGNGSANQIYADCPDCWQDMPVSLVGVDFFTNTSLAIQFLVNNPSYNTFTFTATTSTISFMPDEIPICCCGDNAGTEVVMVCPVAQVTPTASPALAGATALTLAVSGGVTADSPVGLTLSAVNSQGQVMAGYRSTVKFSMTDPKGLLPQSYTFTAEDQGRHTFARMPGQAVQFMVSGSQAVSVQDANFNQLKAVSTVQVVPMPSTPATPGSGVHASVILTGHGPTPTPTLTPSMTATPQGLGVVAAPNISRGGEPIRFNVTLDHPGTVRLILYSLAGEKVYDATVQGAGGLNVLTWQVENNARQLVASGLYVYVLEVEGNQGTWMRKGKVIVLR